MRRIQGDSPPKRLIIDIYVGLPPCPVTVTNRIVIFLVGDPYKPSFTTVTGRGDNPIYDHIYVTYTVHIPALDDDIQENEGLKLRRKLMLVPGSVRVLLLMEEILHHLGRTLGCIKPCK